MPTHKPVEVRELYGELAVDGSAGEWSVIYTKPRQEKKLAEYALKLEIPYYLPLKESIRHYKYRKVTFTKPLFPGYIFTRFDPVQKRDLLASGTVVSFLKVRDQEGLINELRQIHRSLEIGADLRKVEYLETGSRIEIISGPFTGLTGIVRDHKNVKEVILQVNILRQAVAVTATTSQVKLISQGSE